MKCPYRTKVIHKPGYSEGYVEKFAEDITEFCDCIKSECPFYYTLWAHKTVECCRRAESGDGK